jgi:hypothetical protein
MWGINNSINIMRLQNDSVKPEDEALRSLISQKVTDKMINHLVEATIYTTAFDTSSKSQIFPILKRFITQVVHSSQVPTSTLLSSLVYLSRIRNQLSTRQHILKLSIYNVYGVFLSTLILTSKYLNDCSPSNFQWARYSYPLANTYNFWFTGSQINIMEKSLLSLLDWNLQIRSEDLYLEL